MVPTVVRDGSIVPTVRLVAAAPIPKGTEITFDYGDIYSDTGEPGAQGQTQRDREGTEGQTQPVGRGDGNGSKRTPCLCGAENCRGYLPFVP